MRVPRRVAVLLVAALGASVAVLPAMAGSETTPVIDAVNVGAGVYQEHHWQPAQATVAPGGAVTFRNSGEVPHGVEWLGTVRPSCEEGAGKVPVGSTPAASATKWSGTCTFSQPGSYSFYCTVHGAAMSGTIVVQGTATTGTATTTEPPAVETTTATTPPPAPLPSAALQALKLPASQRGSVVRGTLRVAAAGAGGRLEVDLLARRGALSSGSHASGRVRVGRVIRASLQPGKASFAVALDLRARRALRRRGHLALSVTIVITPAQGVPMRLSRAVLVRR